MVDTTMKKTYNNPPIEVVKVQTQQMLAGSPLLGGEYNSSTDGEVLGHGNDFDFED